MNYELIITHRDGTKEKFEIRPESIIDIHAALSFTLKNKHKLGRRYECMPGTLETISNIPTPTHFDY